MAGLVEYDDTVYRHWVKRLGNGVATLSRDTDHHNI
jgi:hypothetical protein